jgi:hypothetical protein
VLFDFTEIFTERPEIIFLRDANRGLSVSFFHFDFSFSFVFFIIFFETPRLRSPKRTERAFTLFGLAP